MTHAKHSRMKRFKHFLQLIIIGFSLSSIVLEVTSHQDGRKDGRSAILKDQISAGRGPASVSALSKKSKNVKKKVIMVKKKPLLASPKKLVTLKKTQTKESIKNWKKWNTFQINLTETYVHNGQIFGTYKLASSNIELARSQKHGSLFSQALKGQLGHMVIKRGKFYLFRPMASHDTLGNLTEVESVDFPIRMYRNGKDRFLSGHLDQNDQLYFYRLKNYVPIFRQTDTPTASNQAAVLLQENYDSSFKFTCNKNQPNTYTCTASVTFTKRYTDMISINTPEDIKNAVAKRPPSEKI